MIINIKQVGDVHFNKYFSDKHLLKLEKLLCDGNTDYVIFTGDIIDSTDVVKDLRQKRTLIHFFENISKGSKIIIELGNHDISKTYDNRKSWSGDFADSFWNRISNINNVFFLPKINYYEDNQIYVFGINPSLYYYENKNLNSSKNEILDILNNKKQSILDIPNDKLKIFISHSPVHMMDTDILTFLNKFQLILSGHMHNGLVLPFMEKIFPKNRGIISPLRKIFPDNARGIKSIKYKNKEIKLVITGGVTKFASSHGIVKRLNKLYPSVIEEISYDTKTKNIQIKTLKI